MTVFRAPAHPDYLSKELEDNDGINGAYLDLKRNVG